MIFLQFSPTYNLLFQFTVISVFITNWYCLPAESEQDKKCQHSEKDEVKRIYASSFQPIQLLSVIFDFVLFIEYLLLFRQLYHENISDVPKS